MDTIKYEIIQEMEKLNYLESLKSFLWMRVVYLTVSFDMCQTFKNMPSSVLRSFRVMILFKRIKLIRSFRVIRFPLLFLVTVLFPLPVSLHLFILYVIV